MTKNKLREEVKRRGGVMEYSGKDRTAYIKELDVKMRKIIRSLVPHRHYFTVKFQQDEKV